ncbi:MAG: MATE family efflux transporter [Coxiellaceae bacterium]|nr:MATE family efflux transporter [Coxiellaceae bacterium]
MTNKIISFKSDFQAIIKLALPLTLSGFLFSAMSFFETVFLAHLGQQILAAGALVGWLFGTLVTIVMGTLSSINILISHKYGANDHKGISLVLRDGIILALILTIPAFLLFWYMAPIFLLFGQDHAIVMLAQSYLHALAWGIFPNLMFIAILEFILGLGHVRIITIFTAIMVTLNIALSFILIFGKFGVPAFGIVGAGLGVTFTNWIMAIIVFSYVLIRKNYKQYLHGFFNAEKKSYLWELFKVGFPMGAMYCIEVAFFFALILLMGTFSVQMLAATQVALQYMGVFMTLIFSVAQAITVRMGHLLGANEVCLAKNAAYIGVFISSIAMLVVALVYWFCPSILISIDFNIHDPSNLLLLHDIEKIFMICAVFQIFEAMRISLFGALRALKDTNFTLMISIISFWCVALPLGYLFAKYFNYGGIGLWWGMAIGPMIGVCLLLWRFRVKIHRWECI